MRSAGLLLIQRGEGFDDADGFEADADDALEEVDDVARVVVLAAPVVGVVHDAALLVRGDGVAFHDPLDGGFAVDDVVVGLGRDAAERGRGVVDDGVSHAFFREAHFRHSEVAGGILVQGVGLHRLVIEVPVGEFAPGAGEGPEVRREGDAGHFLAQVVLKAFAVFRAVQHAVDVIEDVFSADFGVGVGVAELLQSPVSDCVMPNILAVLRGLVAQRESQLCFNIGLFLVPIEGEALRIAVAVEIAQFIGD